MRNTEKDSGAPSDPGGLHRGRAGSLDVPQAAISQEETTMKLPAKWKDRLAIAGMLVLVGFFLHIVAIMGGVVVDVVVGILTGSFDWPVTGWLLRWWL